MSLARSILCAVTIAVTGAAAEDAAFTKKVQPFIADHCVDCHDVDTARAGFRIDLLGSDFSKGDSAQQWKEVMDSMNSGKMPPKKKARPDAKEAFAVASWVAAKLRRRRRARAGECRCGG